MALIGNIETNFGLNASYHNISYFSWDKGSNLVINICSFLDQAARLNNNKPLSVSTYVFSNILTNNQISMIDLYNMLKTIPQFSTMIDG